MMDQHMIAVLVHDHPGVLQRVAGLLGRRGFNIESITVGGCEENGLSRMTIITGGDERTMEQAEKQLGKLIEVIEIRRLSSRAVIARELALIKVRAEPAQRAEIIGISEPFRASVIDIGPVSMIIQTAGEPEKIAALAELLHPYGILELSRTGTTALARGE